MGKRVLWITAVFIMLCSCTALLCVGAVFAAKRAGTVLAVNIPQTATLAPAAEKDASAQENAFPVLIEGTTLIAESLALYEGNMLENDSDAFLVDAAALELRNFGTREVTMTEITLEFEHTEMVFFGTNIPAGGRVLIIEQNGKPWTQQAYTACFGWAEYNDVRSLTEDVLRIEDVDMGMVSVTNTGDEELRDVWLFYKNYLYDAELYLGGITYIEVIPVLPPGEQRTIVPRRYASGYSKFIKAEQVE